MLRYTIFAAALLWPVACGAQAGPVGSPGRYVVVHSPHVQRDTVLLDTATGKTWQIQADASRGNADIWVPLAREDNPAEYQAWLRRNPITEASSGK
jgi:hypothetical protein